MGGGGRYRREVDEVFYRQFVEDQKQYINRKVQQREMLHWNEEGVTDQAISPSTMIISFIHKRERVSCISKPNKLERKVAEWERECSKP